MQRALLTCLTRAVVISQEKGLGATMDSSPKSSEAAKMLITTRTDIEVKAESIILPFQKTLVFSCLRTMSSSATCIQAGILWSYSTEKGNHNEQGV